MSVRRIVTASDRSGKSVFASDETLSPLASDGLPGTEMTYVWGSEDLPMVLSGEVVLELDDKAEKTLRAGDVIIQNGTRHRWVNLRPEPVHMAFIVMGAMRIKKQD